MRIPGIADPPAPFVDSLVTAPGAAPAAADTPRSRPAWRDRPRRKTRDSREELDTVTLHDDAAEDEESEESGLYSGPACQGSAAAGDRRRGLP